jgi:hypothetical protein
VMRLALGVLAAAACTPTVGVLSPTDTPDAARVFDDMERAYARAGTYVDAGEVVDVEDGRIRNIGTFETVFERHSAFRFTYRFPGDRHPWFVAWRADGHVYSEYLPEAGLVDDGKDLASPLQDVHWESGGSSLLIPELLMPSELGNSLVAWAKNATIDGQDAIAGHPCWHVKAFVNVFNATNKPIDFWIDETTLLLRRVRLHHARDRVTTIEYASIVDATLTDQTLAMPERLGDAREHRRERRTNWIGVSTQHRDARIKEIHHGGPADHAGLLVGDQIVSLAGHSVADETDVLWLTARLKKGHPIVVIVRRGDRELSFHVIPTLEPGRNEFDDDDDRPLKTGFSSR